VPAPLVAVFQPTKIKPVLTRLPELPGKVTAENSPTVVADGTDPVVGVFPLYVTVNLHIANTVVGTVTVIDSPTK
jgi:hypothetical protein